MAWTVLEHPEFRRERMEMPDAVQNKLAAAAVVLGVIGPQLGRPMVDTLKGSRHANMKELRIGGGAAWRIAFAFDDDRRAIILVGRNKEGVTAARFYRSLIEVADRRFDDWLEATGE